MKNVFTIFTGDAKTLSLKALYADSLNPLDLTTCTEIDIALPLAGGGFRHLLLTEEEVSVTSPAVLGKFSAPISDEDSLLLKVGELQSFDVTFTIGAEILSVKYANSLSVFEGT